MMLGYNFACVFDLFTGRCSSVFDWLSGLTRSGGAVLFLSSYGQNNRSGSGGAAGPVRETGGVIHPVWSD